MDDRSLQLLSTVLPLLVIAGLIALLTGWFVWGHRRLAGWCFAGTAGTLNLISLTVSIYFINLIGIMAASIAAITIAPAALGSGVAWAWSAGSASARPRRAPIAAWATVLALIGLPSSMAAGPWPLRCAFAISFRALDRLADEAVSGKQLELPRWAGLFRVAGVSVEGENVALITDPNPSGRSGLVRFARKAPGGAHTGPMYNLNFDLPIAGPWRYQNED